ncbi:MAG TPA: hypothetical protein PKA33_08590 [Amaricoccus sp.]|uniref:helix-turn-helix transcriptional regulator n=1 Tax=Amaricoccus sp. TaxID=1872485 RepID=UPI002C1B3C6E|nr:hypothetical protein [Amaricoccus sp.]HMQ94811.1 hypothetical protein [Amaricoccus sp.]HMR52435.1 hypothetical protein [Amaricoccus sp.]HMT99409.1 hypothetical protein [Amaricoccus sp.]
MTADNPISPHFIDAARTAARYGKTIRTIDRWLEDGRLAFPRPLHIGRMRFWRIADLEAWETAQAERSAEAAA